jgi:hypothetical protein
VRGFLKFEPAMHQLGKFEEAMVYVASVSWNVSCAFLYGQAFDCPENEGLLVMFMELNVGISRIEEALKLD